MVLPFATFRTARCPRVETLAFRFATGIGVV